MTSTGVALSATQRRVLVALKGLGEATADELAVSLEISASGVRQHLSALRSAGLITARQERGSTGRPADRYHATDLAEALFAPADSGLSLELLKYLEHEDPNLIQRVFDRRRRDLVDKAQAGLIDKSTADQVNAVTALLQSQGYLVDSDCLSATHYRINLRSCALWPVANKYRQACAAELDFIRELIPEATVQRVTHKTDGDHTCAYDITLRA